HHFGLEGYNLGLGSSVIVFFRKVVEENSGLRDLISVEHSFQRCHGILKLLRLVALVSPGDNYCYEQERPGSDSGGNQLSFSGSLVFLLGDEAAVAAFKG